MRTKKFTMKCKRVLAVVLAFAMMLTTFVDSSFVSKASTETLQEDLYKGRVNYNPEGTWNCLAIDAMEADKHHTGFTEQEILDILNYHAGEKFNQIDIIQPYTCNTIFADVVNASQAYFKEDSNYTIVWYFNDWSGVNPQIRWGMDRPEYMNADKQVDATLGFDGTGAPYISIGSTAGLAAENLFLEYMVDRNQDAATANALMAALGNQEMSLEAADSNVSGDYFVDDWNVFFRLNHAEGLEQGLNYTLQEKAYRGNVGYDRWDDGYEYVTLWIDAMDAGKSGTGFTEQELLDILNSYGPGQFDEVRIKQPESRNVIYKSVAEAALPLFKDYDGKSLVWTFADFPGNTDFTWRIDLPYSMSGDQSVSTEIGFDGDGKPVVKLGDNSNISASNLGLEFGADRSMSVEGPKLVNAFGDQEMDIAAEDSNVDGYYNGRDSWVHFTLWGVDRLDPNAGYTLGKRIYKGDVYYWDDGEKNLEIFYHSMENSGMTFDDATLLSILNQYTDTDFDRIYIGGPDGYTTYSADVWNAALRLMEDAGRDDTWHVLQFGYDGPYSTEWEFSYPNETDQPITLDVETGWRTNENGVSVKLPRTQYPAANVNVTFTAGYDTASLPMFEEALGTSNGMRLDIFDAKGNWVEYADGWYNCSYWVGGYDRNVYINGLQALQAGQLYSVQRATYRGDEWYDEEDCRNLDIDYWGFDDTGVDCSEEAIVDILNQKAASGVKYNTVSITLPEVDEISAEVWNTALSLLKNRDEVSEWQDANIQINYEPTDNSGYITYWTFDWPEMIPADAAVWPSAEVKFDQEGAYVEFGQTGYPAEHSRVTIETNMNLNTYDQFNGMFDADFVGVEYVDEDGSIPSEGYFNKWGDAYGIELCVYDVAEWMTPGAKYRVQEKVYRGDVDSWEEDGREITRLFFWPQDEDGYTEDELIEMLKYHNGKKFNVINIQQPSEDHRSKISMELIKEVVNLLADVEYDEYGNIVVWNKVFFDFTMTDEYSHNNTWIIKNICRIDKELDAVLQIGFDDTDLTLRLDGAFDPDSIDAGEMYYSYVADRDSEMGMAIMNALGEEPRIYVLEGTSIKVEYAITEEIVEIDICDVNKMDVNTEYKVIAATYKGDEYHSEYDGYSSLNIYWNRFAEYGQEFNEEALLSLLEKRAEAGDKFNSIGVSLPDKESMTVSKEVWNTALRLLVPNEWGEMDITLSCEGGDTYDERWTFTNPQSANADITVKGTITFDDADKSICLKFDQTDYPAERVDLGINTYSYRVDAGKFEAALGTESKRVDIALDGKPTGVTGEYYTWRDEYTGIYDLMLMRINELAKGETYKIQDYIYTGDIDVWEDEMGNQTLYFHIFPHNAGYGDQAVPVEEIINILSRNEKQSFDQMYFEYPVSDNNIIYAEVVNEAIKYLKEDGEQIIKFAFVDYETGEKTEVWQQYPSEMTTDQENVTAHIGINADGIPYVNKGELNDLNTEIISMWYETFEPEKIASFQDRFQVNRPISVDGTGVEGNIEIYEESVVIQLGDISAALKDNTDYTLSSKKFTGWDSEWEDGTTHLLINEYGFNETFEEFSEEAVVQILADRAGTDIDKITIVYPESDYDRNTVSKEVWNAAAEALKEYDPAMDDPEKNDMPAVTVCFMREGGYAVCWIMGAPETVEEDVVLDAEFGVDEKVWVQIKANDVPVERAAVSFESTGGVNPFTEILGNETLEIEVAANGQVAVMDVRGEYYFGDEDWYENPFWSLTIEDVQRLNGDQVYVVGPCKYRGDVDSWEEDGREITSLFIQPQDDDGYTEDELIEMLNYHNGKKFNVVQIQQPFSYHGNKVSAKLAKEVIEHLADVEYDEYGNIVVWNKVFFDFTSFDEYYYGHDWIFENISQMDKDLDAVLQIGFDDTDLTLRLDGAFAPDSIDAGEMYYNYVADRNSEMGMAIMNALGEEPREYVLEGTSVEVEYSINEEIVQLSIYDVDEMETNTEYKLIAAAYKGDEDEYDGYSSLSIYWDKFAEYGQEFSEEAVIEILEQRAEAGDTFNSIGITLPSKEYMTISKEIWNTAQQLMVPSDWGETDLTISFDGYDVYDELWTFINAQPTDADITLKSTVTLDDAGKSASLKFDQTNYPADRVDWAIFTVGYRNDADKFVTIFGDDYATFDIALNGTPTGVTADYSAWGEVARAYELRITGLNELAADVTYKTQEYIYTGDIDVWEDEMGNQTSYFHIFPYNAGYGDQAVPVEEIINILSRNEKQSFDQIYFEYPVSDNNIIYAEVVNEAIKYLKEDGEQIIKFAFVDYETGEKTEVWQQYPSEMTTDQENVTAHFGINEDGIPYVNKGELNDLNTEVISMWYETFEPEKIAALQNRFQENRPISVDGTEIEGWVEFNEGNAVLQLENISAALQDNTDYALSSKKFTGWYSEWEDGTAHLLINEYGFNECLEEFSEEAVMQILADKAGTDIGKITIVYPESDYDRNTVSKEVWNAAVAALKAYDPEMNDMPALTVCFMREGGYAACWIMDAPETVEEDVVLDAEFDVDEKVWVQIKAKDVPVERAAVTFEAVGGVNPFTEILGDETLEIEVAADGQLAVMDVRGEYYFGDEDWYENPFWSLMIENVQNLDGDQRYVVSPRVYRGDVGEAEDGRSLYINAEVLGKTKLKADDLEFISYYEEMGIEFSMIVVEQKYASSNVISKDIINMLRPILSDDGFIRFIFCRCEGTDEDCIYNDLVWVLTAPGEATKDINANIALTTAANQGLKVMFNANTYNAEAVRAGFILDQDAKLAQEIIASVEGAGNSRELEEYADNLLSIKKGTEVDHNKEVLYERYDADDIVALSIYSVDDYEAKVSYTLAQVNYIEPGQEVFEVGVPYNWNERMVNEADGAVTWKSLSANTAEIAKDGTMTAVNQGMFVITGTYKMGGKLHTEVWIGLADIVLKNISFNRTEVEVFADSEGFELVVQSYPANAYIEASDLLWSSSEESVVDVDECGWISISGIGTSIITATVPGTDISASCEITVTEKVTIPEELLEEINSLVAVTNFDVTLADIELPEGFVWKNSATKLSEYKGLTSGTFEAVYTNESGYTLDCTALVSFMTINGIHLNAVNFDPEKPYIARGESAIFEYIFDIENGTMEQLAEHEAFSELTFKPTGMTNVEGTEQFIFETNEKTALGKKTVKLAAMYGKKTIATASAVINVTSKLIEGFENVGMEPVFDNEGNIVPNVFSFIFWDPEKYCKLTIASSDTSVVKFGKITYPTAAEIAEAKEQGTPITIVTPYTEGKPGSALVTVTLADEIKSTYKFSHTVLDKEPKVIETAFSINTAYDLKKAPITIYFPNDVVPVEDLTIVNDTKGFGLEVAEYSQSEKKMTGYITLPENTTLKAGTYTVTLKAVVGRDDLGTFEFKIPLKVKVVTTKPSVTIKQTKKVNTFFDQSEGGQYYHPDGYGLMTFTGKTDVITNVSMEADDFELYEVEGNYVVFYKPDDDGKDEKKVTVIYDVEHPEYGTITGMSKQITISTENKAPTLVMDKKSETLYPGYDNTRFYAWDKTTGHYLEMNSVSLVKSAKEIIPISDNVMEPTEVTVGKNTYALHVNDGGVKIELLSRVQGADTMKFRIQETNWAKPIDVTYKVDVKKAVPGLKLITSKLTLNINEDVYRNEIASTVMTLPGYNEALEDMEVSFTGNDAKSKAVLNDQIKLSTDGNAVYARFNFDPNTPVKQRPAGSYSFKVWVKTAYFQTSTNITVSVVNKPIAQNIKLSKSGSIDVLDRDNTYILYTPKLTNLTGDIFDVQIIGQDADNFNATVDYNGKIMLTAKEDAELSTTVNYKVAFRLIMVNFAEDDALTYTYDTPVQTFKVVQGKPKLTITSPKGTTLYPQAGNALTAHIDAVLKNESVEIEDVTLANYTGDLRLIYDAETQNFTLKRRQDNPTWVIVNEINKAGKSWNVKLNVKFKDQAGNVKDTQVTYKVTIK